MGNWTSLHIYIYTYTLSPIDVHKFGREVENIARSHNRTGKYERKRNPNEIKRHKDSKTSTKNVV